MQTQLLVLKRCSCLAVACSGIYQNVDDVNEGITLVDDESGSNWDEDRVDVGAIEVCEEVECEDSKEGDEIIS